MILESGDKVLVVHRRLFEGDLPRFFLGEVDGYESGVARVTGHSWIHDPFSGRYVEKKDKRTKVLALSSGTLMVYQLPIEVEAKSLRFESDRQGRLLLVSDPDFIMDLSETSHQLGSVHTR